MREKIKTKDQALVAPADSDGNHLTSGLINEEYESGILKIKEIIDNTTDEIFISYKEKLLTEPITYIVPAVWGGIEDEKLTTIQKEVNKTISPMISSITEILEFEDINWDQRFVIEYLIRGLMISKITYMIEAFKGRLKKQTSQNSVNLLSPTHSSFTSIHAME